MVLLIVIIAASVTKMFVTMVCYSFYRITSLILKRGIDYRLMCNVIGCYNCKMVAFVCEVRFVFITGGSHNGGLAVVVLVLMPAM